jgi:ferrous iron transport protein A
MDLTRAQEGIEYIIKSINTDDDELDAFLFSLGCYCGEPITVVAHKSGSCVVSIKDARYNTDSELAKAIIV